MNKITVTPKAYSYLRFSTPEQAKGDSFRRQTSMAQQWCLKNGHALDESTSFKDLGVSAFRGNNLKVGRLGDFLEAVRAGAIPSNSTLLVEALDRVTRLEPLDALDVLRSITREGITVVTLNDGRFYTEESLRTNFVDLMVSLMMFLSARGEKPLSPRFSMSTRHFSKSASIWFWLGEETSLITRSSLFLVSSLICDLVRNQAMPAPSRKEKA
jgi:Resolvase, N terminal domain